MYRPGADWIVDAEIFEEFHTRHDNEARDTSKNHRTCRANPVTRAGDCDQTREKSVNCVTHVPLLAHGVRRNHCRHGGRAGGQRRICRDPADSYKVHCGERAAGIEAVPSKPQQKAAAGCDRQVMRQHGTAAVALESPADAWSKHNRARDGNKSTDRVNDGRTCEIMETSSDPRKEVSGAAHRRKKAVRPPGPMTN